MGMSSWTRRARSRAAAPICAPSARAGSLALRKGKLEHEFGVTLTPEDRAELEAYVETLPVEEAPAPAKPKRKPRTARAGAR